MDCGDRPVCDEFDDNCRGNPTPEPSVCDWVDCDEVGDGMVYLTPCDECACQCFSGNAKEQCCPDGLFWNPALEMCDWDFNNPGCAKKEA